MKGLYQKYIVTKTSGKPLADGWEGIVLRIDDGRYVEACRAGALAFAEAVRDENSLLSNDIQHRIMELTKFERLIKSARKSPKGSFLNP